MVKTVAYPIGKITIIKSLIISKLNHSFLSIPNPDDNALRQLNSKMYAFIWDGKPDKVNRELLCQEYCRREFKMINLRKIIQGLN